MKQYRQVHSSPEGYFFRVSLPIAKFQCEERYERASDCAFYADVFKLVLVRRFKLTGNTMWPSLPPEEFKKVCYENGVNPASLDSLNDALPASCSGFLLDGGHDELTKFIAVHATMQKEIS